MEKFIAGLLCGMALMAFIWNMYAQQEFFNQQSMGSIGYVEDNGVKWGSDLFNQSWWIELRRGGGK